MGLDKDGVLIIEPCEHPNVPEPTFDEFKAKGMATEDIRKRWPRSWGTCTTLRQDGHQVRELFALHLWRLVMEEFTSEFTILEDLRAARAEVKKQMELVNREMDERAREGHLWHNGQCIAWSDYEAAFARLESLRKRYGV